MYFIGIDIGTTSICGMIYEPGGKAKETIHQSNQAGIQSGKPWQKTQDPQWILTSVTGIIKAFESKYNNISGIGVTGQMHGILYLDKNGNAISPLYTWQDKSGNQVLDNGITYADFLARQSGYRLATGYGLVTHFYHLHSRTLPGGTVKLCTIMDYVVMKLANQYTPVTDCTNAAGLGFFNIAETRFDVESLNALGIDSSVLPKIQPSAALVGYHKNRIPVYAAIGDNQAGFIGSVADKNSSIHVTIGTSSQISIYSKNFVQVESLDTRPFPGGGYILVGAALSGGQSLSVLQTLFESILNLYNSSIMPSDFYQIINGVEYKENNGAGLTVKTLFNGSRADPFAKGSITDISPENLTGDNLVRGFIRGICYELLGFYNLVPEDLRKDKDVLIGSGNGIKKNELLCRTLEETFQLRMIKSEHDEDAALGACIAAITGAGYADFSRKP